MEDFRENALNNCKLFKKNYKDHFVNLGRMFTKDEEMEKF